VTANNLYATAVPQGIATNESVAFVTHDSNGNAIVNNNGNINLRANQTYYVDYKANGLTTAGQGFIGAGIFVNGVLYPQTQSQAYSNGQTQTVSGSAIITTGATGNVIQLRNTMGPSTWGATSISVIKLA
jgi:hypothetical protein